MSIVIPFRDAESTLEPCIRSILEQDYSEIEVICIDDGSSDRGSALIQDMVIEAGRESQFRILANRGSGLVDALNQGLAECQGDIFLRMDADDVMDPLRVGRQMEHL